MKGSQQEGITHRNVRLMHSAHLHVNARVRCGSARLSALSQPQLKRERECDETAKAFPPQHSRRCHCDGLETNSSTSLAEQLVLTLCSYLQASDCHSLNVGVGHPAS